MFNSTSLAVENYWDWRGGKPFSVLTLAMVLGTGWPQEPRMAPSRGWMWVRGLDSVMPNPSCRPLYHIFSGLAPGGLIFSENPGFFPTLYILETRSFEEVLDFTIKIVILTYFMQTVALLCVKGVLSNYHSKFTIPIGREFLDRQYIKYSFYFLL